MRPSSIALYLAALAPVLASAIPAPEAQYRTRAEQIAAQSEEVEEVEETTSSTGTGRTRNGADSNIGGGSSSSNFQTSQVPKINVEDDWSLVNVAIFPLEIDGVSKNGAYAAFQYKDPNVRNKKDTICRASVNEFNELWSGTWRPCDQSDVYWRFDGSEVSIARYFMYVSITLSSLLFSVLLSSMPTWI